MVPNIYLTNTQDNVELCVKISSGDHTEVIEIDYDPKTVTYEELLEIFWANHEYGLTTKLKRQVNY